MRTTLALLLLSFVFACNGNPSNILGTSADKQVDVQSNESMVELYRSAKVANPSGKYYAKIILSVTNQGQACPGLLVSLSPRSITDAKVLSTSNMTDNTGHVELIVLSNFNQIPNYREVDITGDFIFTVKSGEKEIFSKWLMISGGDTANFDLEIGAIQDPSTWEMIEPPTAAPIFTNGALSGIKVKWNTAGATFGLQPEVRVVLVPFGGAPTFKSIIVKAINGELDYKTTIPGHYAFVFVVGEELVKNMLVRRTNIFKSTCEIIVSVSPQSEAKRILFPSNEMQDAIGLELVKAFGIADFTKISELPTFSVTDNLFIRHDIRGIENLTGISVLEVSGRKLADWSFLGKLPNLETIDLRSCDVTKINFFEGTQSPIKKMYLRGTQITDLSPLKNIKTLEVIQVPNKDVDYSFLKERGVRILF